MSQPAFLYNTGPSAVGLDWVLPHQSLMGKMPYRLVHRPIYRRNSSIDLPPPQMTSVCVKLTEPPPKKKPEPKPPTKVKTTSQHMGLTG